MNKQEEMLKEISGFLHGYLKEGKVSINSFFSKINTNITNIEQLLKIRFLLLKETRDFVQALPTYLKKFKTTTAMHNETFFNEVRGQIDWPQTVKERLSSNVNDKTIFSINENVRSYNTPENIVLKKLLSIIYTILFEEHDMKGFENREWFKDWNHLKIIVAESYKGNIYLQRVDNLNISHRLIQKVSGHRNKLYQNAAKLLLTYQKLINGMYSEEDLKRVLQQTLIVPENNDVLFELYWVIQVIKHNTENSKLYILDGSQNLVASWETEAFYYKLYHDSTGSGNVKFGIGVQEFATSNNPYLKRKYSSFISSQDLANKLFKRNITNQIWQGRPDILLEVYGKDTNYLCKLIIGEVKNTSNVGYAVLGLEELLDYIHLVKNHKGDYLYNSIAIQGILCLGDVLVDYAKTDLVKVVQNKNKTILGQEGRLDRGTGPLST